MAEVAVTLRLMPDGTEVDMKKLEDSVRRRVKVHSVSREPIAFGLEALQIIAVIEDAAGGTDPLGDRTREHTRRWKCPSHWRHAPFVKHHIFVLQVFWGYAKHEFYSYLDGLLLNL